MKSQQKRTPAKKPKQASDMIDTITITGGSGTDSLTVSDTMTVDLGGLYAAGQPALTTVSLPSISLDDLTTTSVTIPSNYTIAGSGSSGYSYTTTGYNWSNTANHVTIDADGLTMKEGADIKIGDKSLTEAIEKIEERLGILNPNPELEDRWDKLKELRRQYIELEKDLLEKEKIMKILKEK